MRLDILSIIENNKVVEYVVVFENEPCDFIFTGTKEECKKFIKGY